MSGLRAARELAGLSQTELARRMSDAGFNWSQMTVSRREENENTLRWNEGIALQDIIDYPKAGLRSSDLALDAIWYRRIVKLVNERETAAVGPVDGLVDVRRDFSGMSKQPLMATKSGEIRWADGTKLTETGSFAPGLTPAVHGSGTFSDSATITSEEQS